MQLYNNDCLEIMKNISDNSVDLIVTDPPYDVSVNHDGGKLYHSKGFDKSNKELVTANIDKGYDIKGFGEEVKRILKHINVYFFCNKKQIPEYFDYYVKELHCFFEIIIWNKTNALPTFNGKYLTDNEFCLYFFEPGYKLCHPESYNAAKTVYYQPINSKDKKLYGHPTIKPLNIIENLILNSSKEGDLVFDPFMGSGTTGIACKLHNRNFIGCEIEGQYFDVACKRIEQVEKEKQNQLF